VPNTTNIGFDRVEAESLLIGLDLAGIAVSTGSACSSGTLEPSHVLKAMGFPPHRTQNSIRFSLGAANTDADFDRTIAVLPGIVEKLRNLTRSRSGRSLASQGIRAPCFRCRTGSTPVIKSRQIGLRAFVGLRIGGFGGVYSKTKVGSNEAKHGLINPRRALGSRDPWRNACVCGHAGTGAGDVGLSGT
jgi:hypothetical protein